MAVSETYPEKYKSGILISREEWIEMIQNESIFRESDVQFLSQMYMEKNHAATCSELALKNGVSPQSYNSPMVNLAKRVLSYLGKKPELGDKGVDRYWNVLFIGRYLKGGHFEWKLRPELEEAIHELYPDLGNDEVNEELDAELIRNTAESSSNMKVLSIDRKRPEPGVVKGITVYPRNRQYALLALEKAEHKCEVDGGHPTFTRRADGLPYTEPHHLIPMARQGEFDVSIDVPENIVSLCSNCHNEIHYGADTKKILTRLFESRKEDLREAGINITLEKLLSYYK